MSGRGDARRATKKRRILALITASVRRLLAQRGEAGLKRDPMSTLPSVCACDIFPLLANSRLLLCLVGTGPSHATAGAHLLYSCAAQHVPFIVRGDTSPRIKQTTTLPACFASSTPFDMVFLAAL
jgi:hypothetical protein